MLILIIVVVCGISGGFYICLMRMNKLLNAARDESENENSTNIKLWGQNDDTHKENTKLKAENTKLKVAIGSQPIGIDKLTRAHDRMVTLEAENTKLKVAIGSQSIMIDKLTRALEGPAVPTESKETPKRKYTKRAVKK